jgi:hypothetical protein
MFATTRRSKECATCSAQLKTQHPRIGEVNVDDLVDNCYIRRLDESGFFDRIYGK